MKDLVKIGEELHELEKLIDSYEISGAGYFIEAGKVWRAIKECGYWKGGGSHIKSFADYIRDRGRKIATVYNQILIATALEGHNLQGCDYTKLLEIARAKRRYKISDGYIEKLIDESKLIPYDGLKDNINQLTGKTTTDACYHENIEAYNRCKDCGKWLKE